MKKILFSILYFACNCSAAVCSNPQSDSAYFTINQPPIATAIEFTVLANQYCDLASEAIMQTANKDNIDCACKALFVIYTWSNECKKNTPMLCTNKKYYDSLRDMILLAGMHYSMDDFMRTLLSCEHSRGSEQFNEAFNAVKNSIKYSDNRNDHLNIDETLQQVQLAVAKKYAD